MKRVLILLIIAFGARGVGATDDPATRACQDALKPEPADVHRTADLLKGKDRELQLTLLNELVENGRLSRAEQRTVERLIVDYEVEVRATSDALLLNPIGSGIPAPVLSSSIPIPASDESELRNTATICAIMDEGQRRNLLDHLERTGSLSAADRRRVEELAERFKLENESEVTRGPSAFSVTSRNSAPAPTASPPTPPAPAATPTAKAVSSPTPPAPTLRVLPQMAADAFTSAMREQFARLNPFAREVIEAPVPSSTLATPADAWSRFHAHFAAVKENLIERDDLARLLELTYATDGSILVMSSHGTGKSRLGQLIGRAKDQVTGEDSFFSLALTPDTTVAETSGGLIVAQAMKAEVIRRWELGVLGHQLVFLDNFFDAKFPFLRTFLKQFNERQYTQGEVIIPGRTRVFVATTSQYINEIFEAAANAGGRGQFDPRANLDRFNTIYWAADEFERTESLYALARPRAHAVPDLYFQDLDAIRADVKRVEVPALQVLRAYLMFYDMEARVREIEDRARREAAADQRKAGRGAKLQPPFRATRVFSTRSLRIATKRIAAEAVLRAEAAGLNEVTVTDADVDAALEKYLLIQAPDDRFLEELRGDDHPDPHLLGQIQTITFEREAWRATLDNVRKIERAALDRAASLLAAVKIGGAVGESGRGGLREFATVMVDQLATVDDAANFTPQRLAALASLRVLRDAGVFSVDEVP